MKKSYLFMLMAVGLLISGNAGATERTAGTIAELKSALSAAQEGDVIKLTADMTFSSTEKTQNCPDIHKSITLDGQGHSITGYGIRGSNNTTLTINMTSGTNNVEVTLKNLTIDNNVSNGRAIETRGSNTCKIKSITIDNCSIKCTGGGNTQPLTIGNNQSTAVTLNITNSYLYAGSGGYPLISFNPYNLTTENTTYEGMCAMYFKGIDGSSGSRGTTVTAKNCDFESPNPYNSATNGFGTFVLEDDGVNITLEDCGMNAAMLGNQSQELWTLTASTAPDRREQPCSMTIKGNNSHLNGRIYSNYLALFSSFYNDETDYYENIEFIGCSQGFCDYSCSDQQTATLTIMGGTYSEDPSNALNYVSWDETHYNFVPSTHEVSTVQQLDSVGNPVTLYRVHKKPAVNPNNPDVAYKLNDNVENQGGGQNPNTSFLLSADETVEAEETNAEYVEIQSGTITVPTGKTLNIGEGGLVIQGDGKLVVEPEATVTVSKGGAITASAGNIVIKSNNESTGSYLLDPVVTFNQQPKATVKMTANVGKINASEYQWHRFAIPVEKLDAPWTKNPERGTYLYEWNYEAKDWALTEGGSTGTKPFLGYTITTANPTVENVEYTFVGNLVGNVPSGIDFTKHGYGYFGNSYTGYMLAKVLLQDVMGISGVAGTVWMWDPATQKYTGASLTDLTNEHSDDLDDYQKEIAPMQTFILLLNSGEGDTINIDYESAIWGNPRYGLVDAPTAAPANKNNYDDAYIRFNVSSASGQTDFVRMTENANNTDEYENGVDATKYMNSNNINLYSTVAGENYTSLYTNNLEGKTLTLQAGKDVNYTLTIGHVEGSDYALEDMLTGNIIPLVEGQTYEFAAQPNETTERFMVVAANKAPTKLNQVVNTKAAKGIYTPLGQYLGESSQWENLPSGIYMIDGVKIVK